MLTKNNHWPHQATQFYERIKILGRGSSGHVWLAREKYDHDDGRPKRLVAIKNISIKCGRSQAYAEREVSILSEIDHPNIINLIHCFDPSPSSRNRCIVMSLANGPNVQDVVDRGGALGIHCVRLVSRHLVAAVSYLHVKAVVHRDIKPANCVLVGVEDTDDPAIWGDDDNAQERIANAGWKLVLVDFGFARAISPEELNPSKTSLESIQKQYDEKRIQQRSTIRRASFTERVKQSARRRLSFTKPIHRKNRDPPSSASQSAPPNALKSISREALRMSAVGTDLYVAPEIFNNMTNKTYEHEALAPCVSEYGMAADAYAVGLSILEVMTGVPPDEDIDKYIDKHKNKKGNNNNATTTKHFLSRLLMKQSRGPAKRRFRFLAEIPRDASNLIRGLTRTSPSKRMTVREAQSLPWISGSSKEKRFSLPQGDTPSKKGDEVKFIVEK